MARPTAPRKTTKATKGKKPAAAKTPSAPPAHTGPLTTAQTRFLRGEAHPLKPLMQVGGKGLSEGLLAELDQLLEQHELVKVKVGAEDREARDQLIEALAERSSAELVQRIGHTAVLYRASKERRRIVLPRA